MIYSDEELVRKILESLRKVQWESYADNPWNKTPEFDCINPDVFPIEKGVYSFNNCDTPETYYIGKAEIGCRNRLDKKLKADWKETRVSKEFRDGVWHHEYEYLTDYQLYTSRICCRTVENDDFSARELESVLLAAYYVSFGRIPKTNRTGVPALSRNENLHADLREIGKLMFENVSSLKIIL
ncbi:MAG: hypothetical protein SH857_12325 [Chitinophagales bacterium]|nr:hypothetical protein [Chitinophagales bacterium]